MDEGEGRDATGGSAPETADSDPGDGAPDTDGPAAPADGDGVETVPCPACGDPIPAAAAFCPHCRTDLTDDGSAVDLSELDGLLDEFQGGLLDDEERVALLQTDAAGRRRASRPIRVLAGLAVSIPLAPLVLYLASAVVDLSLWTGGAVFLAGWLLPAALLSRAPMPAAAFGWSLYLIGAGTALVPPALALEGRVRPGLNTAFGSLTALALLISVVAFALGNVVATQARRRVDGEARYFEHQREE